MSVDIETLLTKSSFQELSKHPQLCLSWLEKYPTEDWNWIEVSSHPNFSIEWIQIDDKIKWKYSVYHLSRNPNLTIEWVKVELDFGWDWEYLLSVKDIITFPEWLEIYPTKKWKDTYWTGISQNNMLTTEFVTQNISKPWKWSQLVRCPQFEFSWLELYLEKVKKHFPNRRKTFELLSVHKKLDISWIQKTPHYPWNFIEIAAHSNFKPEWVDIVPDCDWTVSELSRNPELAWKRLQRKKLASKPLVWKNYMRELSRSHYINYEFIRDHPEIDWEWGKYGVSQNPNFTCGWFRIFHSYRKHMHWGEGGLSEHPNMTAEWILTNKKKNWYLGYLKVEKPLEYKKVREAGYNRDRRQYPDM